MGEPPDRRGDGGRVFEHRPVMATEIVGALAPCPPGVLVDATLGGAGHASALLAAHPHLQLVGIGGHGSTVSIEGQGDRLEFRPADRPGRMTAAQLLDVLQHVDH